MKRIYLAALLGATAVGTAHADEILSGVQNPGNFAPVEQTSKFRPDVNRGIFSGIQNPGSFAPVEQVSTWHQDVTPDTFAAIANPGYGEQSSTGK